MFNTLTCRSQICLSSARIQVRYSIRNDQKVPGKSVWFTSNKCTLSQWLWHQVTFLKSALIPVRCVTDLTTTNYLQFCSQSSFPVYLVPCYYEFLIVWEQAHWVPLLPNFEESSKCSIRHWFALARMLAHTTHDSNHLVLVCGDVAHIGIFTCGVVICDVSAARDRERSPISIPHHLLHLWL